MSGITLSTSGSTSKPKTVFHSWEYLKQCAMRTINEVGLTPYDKVLDIFPANTIAHNTITAYPAVMSGAHLYSAAFNPYHYVEMFKEIQPSYIGLIPKHLELLKNTKNFAQLDMSCVRYMVCGSGKITQEFIDTFRNQGVQLVANWYGMTEMPPPVFVGYNSESFDFTPKAGYVVDFADDGECIINGMYTGDVFDLNSKMFVKRKTDAHNNSTWKTEP